MKDCEHLHDNMWDGFCRIQALFTAYTKICFLPDFHMYISWREMNRQHTFGTVLNKEKCYCRRWRVASEIGGEILNNMI